jgi:hypothetical protein
MKKAAIAKKAEDIRLRIVEAHFKKDFGGMLEGKQDPLILFTYKDKKYKTET